MFLLLPDKYKNNLYNSIILLFIYLILDDNTFSVFNAQYSVNRCVFDNKVMYI